VAADNQQRTDRVAALVLAAGRSTRVGDANKLLATINGLPLVRIVCESALASRVDRVLVVTGHQGEAVGAALEGLDVTLLNNPDFATGLASSLRTGVQGLHQDTRAVVVLLADMPSIKASDIDRLIGRLDTDRGAGIVIATQNGKRGNPVVWSSRFFAELSTVSGDKGGRDLIARYRDVVVGVELGPAAGADLDTRQELKGAGAELP
jgi:molybdenum cofactor cytidylyltransferase